MTNYATNLLSSTQETLKATTGLDLKEFVENLSTRGTTSQVNMFDAPKEAEQNSMKEEYSRTLHFSIKNGGRLFKVLLAIFFFYCKRQLALSIFLLSLVLGVYLL